MSVAFHVVQQKDGTVPLGKLADGTDQRDAIHGSAKTPVVLAQVNFFFRRVLTGTMVERNLPQSFFAEVHESGIDGHPINPSGERRVAAEGSQFAKNLNEGILSQI